MSAQAAIAVFQTRTGIDPETDAHLHAAIGLVAAGLDAEAAGRREEYIEDPAAPEGVRRVEPARRSGRPALSAQLVRALRILVDWLGPADAALAMLVFGLDASTAFPVSTARRRGETRDARILVRRMQRRLSHIARSAV